MPRQYCPTPHCCTAPKRGVCPCQVDEIFRRRSAERMKALHADPEFKAKMKARRGIIPVPEHLRSYAAKLRRNGIRGEEFRKALESAT